MRYITFLFAGLFAFTSCTTEELDEATFIDESGVEVSVKLPAGADFTKITKASNSGKTTDQTIVDITVVQEPDVLEVYKGVTYFESLIVEEVTKDGVNGYDIVGSMIYHTNEFGEFVATINYMDGTQEFIEPADNVEVEISTQG